MQIRLKLDAGRIYSFHLRAIATLAVLYVLTTGASLAAHMAKDKKAERGRVPFILAHGIGEAFVDTDVALDEVADFLDRQRLTATAEA